jgi:hypothetical protein
MQELKKKHKAMTISGRLKSAQEMKNLHLEMKTIQEDSLSRQAQMEPLQGGMEQMLNDISAPKVNIEQIILESGELLKENITTQIVETVAKKSPQVKSRVEARSRALEKEIKIE